MYNLTEIEKEKVIAFNADEIMKEAIKKILLTYVYANGTLRAGQPADPSRNAALSLASMTVSRGAVVSDEDLGRDLRALASAVHVIENAYNQIGTFKKEEAKVESPYNEAI